MRCDPQNMGPLAKLDTECGILRFVTLRILLFVNIEMLFLITRRIPMHLERRRTDKDDWLRTGHIDI